jgi:hypothetical protein
MVSSNPNLALFVSTALSYLVGSCRPSGFVVIILIFTTQHLFLCSGNCNLIVFSRDMLPLGLFLHSSWAAPAPRSGV